MSVALAELKRNALVAAEAVAACPTIPELNSDIAALEVELESVEAWERQCERAKTHGAEYPSPDPKEKASIKAKLAALQAQIPRAEMTFRTLSAQADQADKLFRNAAREALAAGPRKQAFDRFHAALDALGGAASELMGFDHAIGLRHPSTWDVQGYGPAAELVKQLDILTTRSSSMSSLRPSWLPAWGRAQVASVPGVAEGKATALAWLARESGE